jgi:hypothetical protein
VKPSRLSRLAGLVPIALGSLTALAGCRERSSPPAEGDDRPVPDVGDPFLVADATAPPAKATREAGAERRPPGATTATVRLLDPGQPPRRKLRYAWHRDRKETLTIDLRTTAATESEGERPPEVPLPPVRIVVAIEPRDVSQDGGLTYAWHVTSTKVTPTAGSNPQLAEGMDAEVAAIAHLSGTAQISARGLAKDVAIDPASLGDVRDSGATGEMVEQVRQTLFDLDTPMPEEEVGRGGRWEKIARLASRSAVVTQSETFTLASLTGDRGAVDDVLAQTAPPQDWPAAGAAASDPARLDSMLATGTVRSRFDLARIVPSTIYAGRATMVVSGHPGADASRSVTMILRVDIALSGTPP